MGSQENKSCSKVLNFLERLDDRIRCTHKETVAVVKPWKDVGSNKSHIYAYNTRYINSTRGTSSNVPNPAATRSQTLPTGFITEYKQRMYLWLSLCTLYKFASMRDERHIVQELCESLGGRPGLSVLTILLVSVDIKNYWAMIQHQSQLVPNMLADIWGH